MEKYRYVIQSGILFLLCILQVYSNFGIYKDYSKNNKDPNITSLSSTTHNYRNIDKNKQKWYNRSARKKAEKSKKACT